MCDEALLALFDEELILHREIDAMLVTYFHKGTDPEIAAKILTIHATLAGLYLRQAGLLDTLLAAPAFSAEHLLYVDFLDRCLTFTDDVLAEDRIQIKLALYKLFTSGAGRNLFASLSEQLNAKKVKVIASDKRTMHVEDLTLFYPPQYHTNSVRIVPGKTDEYPIIATVTFISVGHEFIHLLQNLLPAEEQALPYRIHQAERWLYSLRDIPRAKEFRTVEMRTPALAGVCENSLRESSGIAQRGGWQSGCTDHSEQ